MPSPFPGMNPYIERPDVWNDFHDTFIPVLREVLAPLIRPNYYVRIEENLYVHEPEARERFRLGKPDLSVHSARSDAASAAATVAAPAYVGMPVIEEEERLPYLEIRDRFKHEVVTVIELLSPANKDDGRDQYLAKVQRVLASKANFVEIDLLRAHPKMPWDQLPECDYYAVVSRHAERSGENPRAAIWPFGVRDPMPTIPIPLRGEAEPLIDLKAITERIHDTAGYDLFLYEADPEPPLRAADAVWAAQILNPPAS